ncbi:hypothetical protein HCBG_03534 [Histoplasma capsulatum G186AR]|uniref:Uncharacterized protein n=1 Tax=Ajellomyces capsulatus (strain G186AR / H82 / ATCC MYA-2454 / RMSCC 2432) TaxID=447093 RepID=C0NK54_AJECG|nr:uncharacterized protein HCBG_03534 [Histoplasma capsulatum G186AR]EEH08245.1 hypothetical protein HCBG_03534 [Histoplasma capsulatum G186AR]
MATPPPDTVVPERKTQPPPVVDHVSLDAELFHSNPVLETKTVTVRLSETMSSEPQVIEEPTATDENKPLPPAVNGNGITQPQPLSNGVIGTTKTDTEDSSSLLSPLEVSLPNSSSQDTATTTSTEGLVSTKPVSQTSPGLHADSSSTQPDKEAAVLKAETTAVITNEATNVDVLAQVSSEPSDLQPSPSTNPRSQDFQGESKPSSVDTTTETLA